MRRICGLALPACALALGLAVGAGCNGPFGYFAGGALEGEVVAVPAVWPDSVDGTICQLETHPREPYSVNVACTVLDGVLYINAGGEEKRWVANMNADPAVRVRIDGRVYEMRAARVKDEAEIARFGRAWTDQSFFRRDPTAYEEVWIYRLAAR